MAASNLSCTAAPKNNRGQQNIDLEIVNRFTVILQRRRMIVVMVVLQLPFQLVFGHKKKKRPENLEK